MTEGTENNFATPESPRESFRREEITIKEVRTE